MRIVRRGLKVGGNLLVLFMMIAGLGALAPQAHAAQYEATVTFTSVQATDQGITLTGSVRNTGTDPLYRAQVVLWRDRTPLTTPTQLDTALAADPTADTGDRILQDSSVTTICSGTGTFIPNDTADFSVSASWDDLGITADGAYLVGVHVRGADVSWGSLVTIGRGRTLVTVATHTQATASTVVPLTSAPSLLHDSVFLDDHLASELTGRLSTFLALAHKPGTTWAIDPALLHAITVMSQGYQVVDGSTTVDGLGQARATAWLASFATLDRSWGYRLPWGNPDLALGALLDDPTIVDTALAAQAAQTDAPDIARLPLLIRASNAHVDDAFLSYVAPLHPSVVLAQATSSALLPEGPPTTVPQQGVLLATAPVAYPTGPGPDAATPLQLTQRALADDAVSDGTVIRVIESEADALVANRPWPSWVTPVTLSSIPVTQAWTPDMSLGQPAGPLTQDITASLDQARTATATYASLIGDAATVSAATTPALAAITSQSWDSTSDAEGYADAVTAWISSILARVTLTVTPEVTLTARTSTFPVTVSNKLSVPVYVRIATQTPPADSSPGYLSIPTTDVWTIHPGDNLSIPLPATVLREGEVQVTVGLTTTDGQTWDAHATVKIDAKTSAWMGWAVVGSAIVLLVVGTFLRVRNRQRHKTKEA
ncbi:MAG: DUF6049 family protein [Propionibacteriaceae bacterium]|nr:DUF6049 family protein [Propionibacteriaceae bacterium]